MGTKEEFVKVRKKDLERLTTEVMQIRDFLPRILNGEVLESFQKLKIVEKSESYFISSSRCWWRQSVLLCLPDVDNGNVIINKLEGTVIVLDYIWESQIWHKKREGLERVTGKCVKFVLEEGLLAFWGILLPASLSLHLSSLAEFYTFIIYKLCSKN